MSLEDLDIQFKVNFELDSQGLLNPVFQDIGIDFGRSSYSHSNWFMQIFIWQLVEFSIEMITNATNFVGTWLFDGLFGPILSTALNDYQYVFSLQSPFAG